MFPKSIQNVISNYQILGWIPLDKVLHFIVGMALTLFLIRFKLRLIYILVSILALALIKEYIDSFAYTSHWLEHSLDALTSITYPVILYVIRYIRRKN